MLLMEMRTFVRVPTYLYGGVPLQLGAMVESEFEEQPFVAYATKGCHNVGWAGSLAHSACK
jgi:hypothetical protein